jgi:ABC-type polysaccharide/polyol phosphate export permease
MNRPIRQQVELVLSLAKRDLKTRYKDSVLGFFWSLFRPAFLTLILWVVFSLILRLPAPNKDVPYWLHMLVSVLAWNFFVGSLTDATHSILVNSNLVKKVRLDAEVFPIACILANAVHFLLALALVLLITIPVIGGFSWQILLLPAVIAVEALLILGLALFLSSLNVFFRDVGSLFDLVSMAWFYVTPIIYPVWMARQRITGAMGEAWFHAYMANPMAPVIIAMRHVTLYGGGEPEMEPAVLLAFLGVSTGVGIVLTAAGWALFRKLSDRFADEL